MHIIKKNKHQFKNNNELFNKLFKMHKYYNIKNPFVLNDLLSILQFCKINCVFKEYMIINFIYKKSIYTINYSKHSLLLFNPVANKVFLFQVYAFSLVLLYYTLY